MNAAFPVLVAGGLVVTWILVRRPFAFFTRDRHVRTNYRGTAVAGTLGVLLVVPLAAGLPVAIAAGARLRVAGVVVAAGVLYGVLGFVDDVYGDRSSAGLLGHAKALIRGRVTTGAAKAAGGAGIGLVVAWVNGWRGPSWLVAGAVVAMSAHVANLLDVRPGRALKVWLPAWIALCATGTAGGALATAALGGGAAAFLPLDLRERAMLGDAGAGILGASLGAAAVAVLSRTAVLSCAAVLAFLTLASEAVSFTRVIERVGPLRWADRLGRPGRRHSEG